MTSPRARRFGITEVASGLRNGDPHVATKRYREFVGELTYLQEYLAHRLLLLRPEERAIANVTLMLQNFVEHELELVIAIHVRANPTMRHREFLTKIETDFVSFKAKYDWARARNLLSDHEAQILEELRIIRNAQTHVRPELARPKLQYFGKPLLTRKSLQRIFLDIDALVQRLRVQSGNQDHWQVIPPGYAKEMGWTD
jgi:hypothetical protein